MRSSLFAFSKHFTDTRRVCYSSIFIALAFLVSQYHIYDCVFKMWSSDRSHNVSIRLDFICLLLAACNCFSYISRLSRTCVYVLIFSTDAVYKTPEQSSETHQRYFTIPCVGTSQWIWDRYFDCFLTLNGTLHDQSRFNSNPFVTMAERIVGNHRPDAHWTKCNIRPVSHQQFDLFF